MPLANPSFGALGLQASVDSKAAAPSTNFVGDHRAFLIGNRDGHGAEDLNPMHEECNVAGRSSVGHGSRHCPSEESLDAVSNDMVIVKEDVKFDLLVKVAGESN